MTRRRNSTKALAFCITMLMAIPVLAQTTVFWDTNSNTAGASAGTTAAGTWDNATTGNWSTSAAGTNVTTNWAAVAAGSKNATFSAGANATGAFTVTVTGAVGNVGGLTFQEGTVTLAGAGTLNLTGTAAVNVQTAQANISTILGSVGGINTTGTGILVLSGANTFSGGTTVTTGTLGFGSNTAAGTGTLTLAGGTIYADTAARSLTNAVTVSGNFSVGGTNNLTLSGATALGAANRTITVDNTGVTTLSGIVSSAGASGITKAGAGTLVLSGANTFTGNITANAGTVSIANDGNLGNAANNVTLNGGTLQSTGTFTAGAARIFTTGASGGTIDVSTGQTLTLGAAGQLTGAGDLTKTSAGTLALSTTNAGFTGNTNVNGGTLRLSTFDALGTSGTNTLTLNNGAQLDAAFANATNVGSNIVINNGSIVRTNATTTKSGFLNNAATSTLTVNGNAQLTNQGGAVGSLLSFDGVVQVNTGGNITATAVTANDEVRFGGAQTITLAAGSSITTAGAGAVNFGNSSGHTIIAQGTSAQQATLTLGAATTGGNAATAFQINGSGTGGLLVTGTKAKVDNLMTDARLAATTGSGGALTVAYTDAGSRTLGTAANLTVASGVVLGLQSNGGTFTVGTAGGGTHDLGNWGGLQVGANTTITYADNNVFGAASSLTMLGGTLNLNNTVQNIGTLTVTGNSIIDFAGGASTLNVTNLFIQAGSTLTILNWQNSVDFFTAANWTGATYQIMGSAPMNYVTFTGNSANVTGWDSFDNQIRPNVPEPSTYGAILFAALLGLFGWRRYQAARAELTLRPVLVASRGNRN